MVGNYALGAEIEDYDPKRSQAIRKALKRFWPFTVITTEIQRGRKVMVAWRSDGAWLGRGGETEIVNRLAKEVWKANKGWCRVTARIVSFNHLPCETYVRAEKDYRLLMKE